MGRFDRLLVPCECGRKVEFQSKAGECLDREYTISNCPSKIASDLIGESSTCECGSRHTLSGTVHLMATGTPSPERYSQASLMNRLDEINRICTDPTIMRSEKVPQIEALSGGFARAPDGKGRWNG